MTMKSKRFLQFFNEYKEIVVTISVTTVIFVVILWVVIYFENKARGEPKQYCGEVVSRGYDEPTSGYKTHTDPVYYVIIKLYNGYRIRVDVDVPTYYSDKPVLCFMLDKRDLSRYGNGNKHLIP